MGILLNTTGEVLSMFRLVLLAAFASLAVGQNCPDLWREWGDSCYYLVGVEFDWFGLVPPHPLTTSHGPQESQVITELVYRCGQVRIICGTTPAVMISSFLT